MDDFPIEVCRLQRPILESSRCLVIPQPPAAVKMLDQLGNLYAGLVTARARASLT